MDNYKTVLNRLYKTEGVELKSEKVELALVDDLKKYSDGFKKYKSEGDGLINRANRILSELKETQSALFKWSDVGESIGNDIIKDMNKFESAAKELGINPNTVKEYTAASKLFTSYAKLEQEYQKIAKSYTK
tara:strand:- start:3821 stop:4216 length:396 start_codon:yes stop_codon:yes gene_type:complete